ncbi:DUF1549 domain-containing protein [Brevifollis gellanilyticus]|uniref:S-layer protein n=1 Tax=Brevifollis gellanilyticus TaxID=748831 RepID=A0A512M219_9BACT|nr:DUF1549 domain-containing protein [Brevifollis gellanilyticus]GEP40783.1 S-layer protein [Brevifollis gellanilyticus]
MRSSLFTFLFILSAVASASAEVPSFRNTIQPILTRYGCAMGACHGAAAGQGGFRLSLRGFDDEGDWLSITRSAKGRRLTLEDPARSLFLLKAVKAVPHKGDKRFEANSPEYKAIVDWIAAGAPGPKADDARITSLEVSHPHVVSKPGQTVQLKVTAKFSDGHTEDVTRWSKYVATNASVATVDDNGLIKTTGSGEGTVSAWYLSRLAISTVTIPNAVQVQPASFAALKPRNFVDEHTLTKLRELNIPPSARADDHEFIRRVFVDTLGILPTAEEARAFFADTAPDKRDRLIDALLKRPEFVDYWAHRWSDLLLVNGDKLMPASMWSYYNWIRRHVAANTPWDAMVRDLLTATGSTLENGAGNFFILNDEPTKCAETVSVAFMGTSIGCAKCHNHPLEKWTHEQYFAFANLFARVRTKNGAQADERVLFSDTQGDIVTPLTGKPQEPRPLDSVTAVSMTSTEDRRITLAKWLTGADNKLFQRAIVNRVWANFFGSGLVEPVDDLRVTNPASNEPLFAAACDHLVQQKFNLKALMRTILQSETYQRSSVTVPENINDLRYGSHYVPRRLKAEVLLDTISQATAAPTTFKIDRRNANRGTADSYPMGFRALQLPDSNIASYFLKSFGRADRVATCECERTNEPSMAQALHIANGDTMNAKLSEKNNRLDVLLASKQPDEKVVEEAYLLTLTRPPSMKEKQKATELLATAKPEERRVTLEDLFWSLMSSKEFLFNH